MSLDRYIAPEEFEARLRAELDRRMAATPAMLHSIDERGCLISVSDAWLAKLGYSREEVLGRPSAAFLTPESRERAVREVMPSFFRLGRCDNIEYQMVKKDGGLLDVLLSAVLADDPTGSGRISLAVVTDVTALKETKRLLTLSEQQYRGLVEDQSEMVSLASPDGELRYANHAYAAFYGRTPEEMVGKNLFDFVPPEERGALADHFKRVCESRESIRDKNQVMMPNGERRWFAWVNRALTDAQGQITAIHSVGRDIQDRAVAEQRLQESEARYRFLAENSTDIIALLRPDGTRHYVSPACRALTGFEPEEMMAVRTRASTHPDDAERVAAALANQTEQSAISYRMRRKDGSYVWVETMCKPVMVEGQGELRLAIVRNIEERIAAERLMQESEARYRFLAENSADLIILVDRDGNRSYASPASRQLLGYEPEEMLAIRTRDAIHPDDAERVVDAVATGGQRRSQTYRMRRKDGSYVWVETTGRPVEIAGQGRKRLIIVRDIEKRMADEQRLRDSEARYRFLADNSTDMVFQLDRDLVRRYVSPACREILGYEPEELTGINPVNMAHPEDAPRLTLVLGSLMEGRADRLSIVNRIRHRDGRWIWVEAQLRALRDSETNKAVGIIGALRDISVRKAIEDELAKANQRLQALAVEDALTGLANRRAFDEGLAKEYRRARRDNSSLSLIMIDVDRFKAFNDTYGHPAGDSGLKLVAQAIADSIRRPADLAARYGGEEFAVVLPDTDEAGAAEIATRIRQAVLALKIKHKHSDVGVMTISAGVASIHPLTSDEAPEALVSEADRALYLAKGNGRNRVIGASMLGGDDKSAAVA